MSERVFGFFNANADILVPEQQEGGSPEDHYAGSIGDVSQKHIQSLSDGERQMWEQLIHMPSGHIFRMYPNTNHNDRDILNIRGRDTTEFVEYLMSPKEYYDPRDGLTKTVRGLRVDELESFQEAINEENQRQEQLKNSEDVMDHETSVPFRNWEMFPQVKWSTIDIPSTPPDGAAYMGNTYQNFYDEIPEGHPDSNIINACISALSHWEDYLDFNKKGIMEEGFELVERWTHWFETKSTEVYVAHELVDLINEVICYESDNPDDLVRKCLDNIDKNWSIQKKNQAAAASSSDKMTPVMLKKKKEWKEEKKAGITPQVKSFGKLLFDEFKEDMKGYHWNWYRNEKKKYAPKVMLQGIDINRATLAQLKYLCYGDKNAAEKLWFARPFESLEVVYAKNLLPTKCFSDDETTDKILEFIEKHTKIALKENNVSRMTEVSKILINLQRDKKEMTSSQWGPIWRFYKLNKQEVLNGQHQNG